MITLFIREGVDVVHSVLVRGLFFSWTDGHLNVMLARVLRERTVWTSVCVWDVVVEMHNFIYVPFLNTLAGVHLGKGGGGHSPPPPLNFRKLLRIMLTISFALSIYFLKS